MLKPRKVFFRRLFDWWNSYRHWMRKKEEALTLVVISKGHLEVQKVHLSALLLKRLKLGLALASVFLALSAGFFVYFVVELPRRSMLEEENLALRTELQNIHFHLDTLQTSVNRMSRFDQKLRALTEVDKEFAQIRGPKGQGGRGEMVADFSEEIFDLGDAEIPSETLELQEETVQVVDRRTNFQLQKVYSWFRRLYRSSEMESQSLEELFEVLKGREIQLSATPTILPVRGWVTSHYGHRHDPINGRRKMHYGIDVAARRGASVVAPAEGMVSFAGKNGSFGKTLMIFHGYGVSTLYAHLEDILVRPGQEVSRGDILGTVGSSGRSTGAHLHYEISVHGVRVDPRKFIVDRRL